MLFQRLCSREILVDLGPNQLPGLVVLLIWMIDVEREIGKGRANRSLTFRVGIKKEIDGRVNEGHYI